MVAIYVVSVMALKLSFEGLVRCEFCAISREIGPRPISRETDKVTDKAILSSASSALILVFKRKRQSSAVSGRERILVSKRKRQNGTVS